MNQEEFHRSAISPGDCISNGWAMVKENYGLYLGISVVGLILSGCIPCVSLFISGPIIAGIYFVYLRQMSGQPVEFGMMFKGFEVFVPAMVIGIILAIPEIVFQGTRLSLNFAQIGLSGSGRDTEALLASGMLVFLLLGGGALMLIGLALRISLYFALPLIMEKQLGVGDAIKLSFSAGWANFGGIFLLSLLEGLILVAGLMVCIIGIFFVIPIVYAANAFAYRQVFPDTNQPGNYAPPSPAEYGSSFGQGQ